MKAAIASRAFVSNLNWHKGYVEMLFFRVETHIQHAASLCVCVTCRYLLVLSC